MHQCLTCKMYTKNRRFCSRRCSALGALKARWNQHEHSKINGRGREFLCPEPGYRDLVCLDCGPYLYFVNLAQHITKVHGSVDEYRIRYNYEGSLVSNDYKIGRKEQYRDRVEDFGLIRKRSQYCKRGHRLTPRNLRPGTRTCRICSNLLSKERKRQLTQLRFCLICEKQCPLKKRKYCSEFCAHLADITQQRIRRQNSVE